MFSIAGVNERTRESKEQEAHLETLSSEELTLFHKIHLEVLGREQCVGERSSLKPLHLNMLKDDVDNKAVQLVCKLALCSLCPHVDDTD